VFRVGTPASATRTESQLPLSAIPEHKRLDVPRCGSIQWIHTNCHVHGLERHHG
jgi:hypothetical protein